MGTTVDDMNWNRVHGMQRILIGYAPARDAIYATAMVGPGRPAELWHGPHVFIAELSSERVDGSVQAWIEKRAEEWGEMLKSAATRAERSEACDYMSEQLDLAIDRGEIDSYWDAGDWILADHRLAECEIADMGLEKWVEHVLKTAAVDGVILDRDEVEAVGEDLEADIAEQLAADLEADVAEAEGEHV